jgi:hypothetical protein
MDTGKPAQPNLVNIAHDIDRQIVDVPAIDQEVAVVRLHMRRVVIRPDNVGRQTAQHGKQAERTRAENASPCEGDARGDTAQAQSRTQTDSLIALKTAVWQLIANLHGRQVVENGHRRAHRAPQRSWASGRTEMQKQS